MSGPDGSDLARRRDLARFLSPRSIAVVGASDGTEKVGGRVMHNLIGQGFEGALHPVNPRGGTIHGRAAVASIAELPDAVDLAFLCIPAVAVEAAVEACAARGIANVLVGSSGFADLGADGLARQERLVETVRREGMRLSGPNAEGFFNVPARIAATFSPAIGGIDPGPTGPRRRVGIVAQSGGLAYGLYNQGRPRGLSFGTVIAVGNQADLEAADYIEALLDDPDTATILVYLEGIKTPSRFVAAAERAASLGKPLIVARVGQSEAGRRAVASHTGSLSGSQTAWEAIADRHGIVRASGPEEMLDLAQGFTRTKLPQGNRLAVITVSGGTAAWMVDICATAGMTVPPIDASLRERLLARLPSYGAASNPIDMAGHDVDALADSLTAVLESPDFDAVVMLLSLAFERRLRIEGEALARIIHAARQPVLVYSYTTPSPRSIGMMEGWDLPVFSSMESVARILRHGVAYASFLRRRAEGGADRHPAPARAALLGEGDLLCEYEAKTLLAAYGITGPAETLATDADAAVAGWRAIGGPVALKIQSPQIPHKTEAGGVALKLDDAAAVAAAFEAIMSRARAHAPRADLRGVLVQPMSARGIEMIVGAMNDPEFGPMMMVGLGGVHVEVFGDVAFAPAPLSPARAGALLDRLRAARLLDGVRGAAAADRASLVDLLVRVSELAHDFRDEIAEIDLNPVIVHAAGEGLTIVDALVMKSGGVHG